MPLRNRILPSLLLIAAALLLTACGSTTAEVNPTIAASAKNQDGYVDITVEQLNAMLPDKDFTLVNTHIPFEGDLPQTDVSIAFDEIQNHLDQLPADKDAPIVLYCRSGNMSTQAAETLVGLGYTNVSELDGGFNAWRAAGYEMAP